MAGSGLLGEGVISKDMCDYNILEARYQPQTNEHDVDLANKNNNIKCMKIENNSLCLKFLSCKVEDAILSSTLHLLFTRLTADILSAN